MDVCDDLIDNNGDNSIDFFSSLSSAFLFLGVIKVKLLRKLLSKNWLRIHILSCITEITGFLMLFKRNQIIFFSIHFVDNQFTILDIANKSTSLSAFRYCIVCRLTPHKRKLVFYKIIFCFELTYIERKIYTLYR